MQSRSFHLVMAFITFMLTLLIGCIPDPVIDQSNTLDTTTTTDTAIAQPDQATQNQIDRDIRFDSWVQTMNPFVTENSDWTYTFDDSNFLASIVSTHPEVMAYYEGSGSATEDTVVIDVLLNGLPLANQFAFEQYELTANGTIAPPPSVYSSWQWYGYKISYTGSDSDRMIATMGAGGAYLSIPGIGTVSGPVLAAVAGLAWVYDSWYGGFSIRIYWTTNISLGAP